MTSPPKIASSSRMRRLKKAWPTRFISAVPPYFADDVLDGVAGAHVVDHLRARMLHQERLGQQRRDEVAGDELAAAVDEEAAIGVAVPRDPDVRLFLAPPARRCRWRFSSMSGLASWFGNVPSMSKHSFVTRHGSRSNSFGATRPAMPLPRVEHDVERLDDERIDERHHVLDVVVEHVLRCDSAAGRRRLRGGSVPPRSCRGCRRCPPRRSAETPRGRTILMPLYSFGLCDAVICAPPS